MLYPESASARLDAELFRHPTAAYRGVPFWSWNCRVTRELIDWQLECFKAMGFGGVDIHPRTGLDTAYLGEEYMALVEHAVRRCRELGLYCWLYDDDRFPSGAADGLVTRDWRWRQRCLLLTERRLPGYLPDRESLNAAIEAGEHPLGYFAATYAVALEGGVMTGYRRLAPGEAARAGERVRYAYVKLLEPEDWFEGQTYVDVMNPQAIRAFIDVTHEAYWRRIGGAFGGTVPAIFTDEPRMETRTKQRKALSDGDSHEDVVLPWSEPLRERMRRVKGIDPMEIVPELVWELPEGKASAARYHFRDAACEQFVAAFLDQIGDWCRAHGILMTGHVLSEDTLSAQAASLGEAMRCYRGMDVPGIDVLCDERQFLAAKQAASVAHQLGREGVVSELYGVTLWNCDFKTFKLQGDWQAALGVTGRVPHLAWMSMEGEAKRDWPGSIFCQAPWWREYAAVETYFARLNTVLTRGKSAVRTAVIHPVESVWLHIGTDAGTSARRCAMDARFDGLIRALLDNLVDFDLISEAMLPGQSPRCDEDGLHMGEMCYSTVVVPDMETMRGTTLDALERFVAAGGRLIFAGALPTLEDARPSGRAARLAERCETACDMDALCEGLHDETGVKVSTIDGRRATGLLAQRRVDGDVEWLFLCHAYPGKGETATPERYVIRLRGAYDVARFDAMTGEITREAAMIDGGSTALSWNACAEDSLLLRLSPLGSDAALPLRREARYEEVATLMPEDVRLAEPNMLLLDYARARVDGGALSEKQEILRLDNAIRGQLGFKSRCGVMMQPWAMEPGEAHAVALYYEINAEVAGNFELGIEHPERCAVRLNGVAVGTEDRGWYVDRSIRRIALPALRVGKNVLEVRLPFDQKTNLENLYLLGDFDVAMRPAGESVVVARRLLGLGDMTRQGKPFYSGVVTYRFALRTDRDGRYAVRVPKFAAAVLTVRLDGAPMGQIAYAPHQLSLGALSPGRHELEIDAFIGRHNGFGALHNSNDAYVWFGPDSWRTEGGEWTDDYRVLPCGLLSNARLMREV